MPPVRTKCHHSNSDQVAIPASQFLATPQHLANHQDYEVFTVTEAQQMFENVASSFLKGVTLEKLSLSDPDQKKLLRILGPQASLDVIFKWSLPEYVEQYHQRAVAGTEAVEPLLREITNDQKDMNELSARLHAEFGQRRNKLTQYLKRIYPRSTVIPTETNEPKLRFITRKIGDLSFREFIWWRDRLHRLVDPLVNTKTAPKTPPRKIQASKTGHLEGKVPQSDNLGSEVDGSAVVSRKVSVVAASSFQVRERPFSPARFLSGKDALPAMLQIANSKRMLSSKAMGPFAA